VSIRDVRKLLRLPGNQASIRSHDGQVGRIVLRPRASGQR
jgi:hypothetical protein